MKCEIVKFFTEDGHKILTQEAVPVKPEDIESDHVQQTIKNMLDTLRAQGPGGVGIAANQIGSNLAIFVIDVRPPEDVDAEPLQLVAINPEIIEYKGKPVESSNPEGCLSGETGDPETTPMGFTTRHPEVTLCWTDEQGEKHKEDFDGVLAWFIQHETDHLNGIFFTDKIETGPRTKKDALAAWAICKAKENNGSTQE